MLKKIFFLFFLIVLSSLIQVNAEEISIVHFSDTHIDTKSPDKEIRKFAQTVPIFQRAIQKTNSINPDIVVFSGDMVNKPLESEFDVFLNLAKKLKIPFYVALGNHDVGVLGGLSKEKILTKLNENTKWLSVQNNFYSVEKKGYIFVFMDGTTDKIISANGFFSKENLIFLEKTLAQNPDKKIIIVQHFPLMPPYKSLSHEILNKGEYFNLIDKYPNLIMVLSGHYHAYSEILRNNVLHITTPSMVQAPFAFRHIKIVENENEIIIETILYSDEVLNPLGASKIKQIKLLKK